MNPQHLVFAVCLLFQINNNSVVGTATGFFVEHKGGLFLITNKHVVQDDNGNPYQKLIAKVRTDSTDLSKIGDLELILTRSGERLYFIADEQNIDIAVIKINDQSITKQLAIKPIKRDHFPPPQIDLNLGSDLLTVGYPVGFTDQKTLSPIGKVTTLATPITLHFDGNPFFLMDGNLKKGMSGSPVFTKPSILLIGKEHLYSETSPKAYFLGIHSATYSKTVGSKLEPVYVVENGVVKINELKEMPINENLELHTCFFNGTLFALIEAIP